jgi:hypothetical protein
MRNQTPATVGVVLGMAGVTPGLSASTAASRWKHGVSSRKLYTLLTDCYFALLAFQIHQETPSRTPHESLLLSIGFAATLRIMDGEGTRHVAPFARRERVKGVMTIRCGSLKGPSR